MLSDPRFGHSAYPVVLPAATITVLNCYVCDRCLGYGPGPDDPNRCPECLGAPWVRPGEKMTADLFGRSTSKDGLPYVDVLARLRYPWEAKAEWYEMPRCNGVEAAWGPLALWRAALRAVLNVCRGQGGVGLTGIEIAPIPWPAEWPRTRRAPGMHARDIMFARLDWPEGDIYP